MMPSQNTKLVNVLSPQAITNNASFTTTVIDTLGYEYVEVVAMLGATDIAFTALKIQECDTSGGSYTDVTGPTNYLGNATGLIYGTSALPDSDGGTASALPTATDDNHLFVFDVDMRARKRFLKLVATIGSGSTGGFLTALAILSRPTISPVKVADRGITGQLRV